VLITCSRKYALIIRMRLLVVIGTHILFFESYVSLSDEGDVYLHECLSEDIISARDYDPLLLARSFNFLKIETIMTVLLRAFSFACVV